MSSRTWTKEQLIEAVKNSKTYVAVATNLGLNNYGSNNKTIKKYIKLYALDTSHFSGRSHLQGQKRPNLPKIKSEDLFIKNSKIDRGYIRRRVISENIFEYKCIICSISNWQNLKLVLHLDHINGINNDHRLCNLRWLCPNCHSQTDTYCGNNNSNKIIDYTINKDIRAAKNNKVKLKNYCIVCNTIINKRSDKCKSCSAKAFNKTKIDWIPTEELIKLTNEKGFVAVGKLFGVTDNAVRKRIRNHPVKTFIDDYNHQYEYIDEIDLE